MISQQSHEMQLETRHESGAEEWYCPLCGRRLLMNWGPKYKKTVLKAGDEYAMHSGGKGGLRIESAQITPPGNLQADEISEQTLRPWIKAIKKLDFNW